MNDKLNDVWGRLFLIIVVWGRLCQHLSQAVAVPGHIHHMRPVAPAVTDTSPGPPTLLIGQFADKVRVDTPSCSWQPHGIGQCQTQLPTTYILVLLHHSYNPYVILFIPYSTHYISHYIPTLIQIYMLTHFSSCLTISIISSNKCNI